MPLSQLTPKFQTPYRGKRQVTAEKEKVIDHDNARMEIGAAGDMLDSIGRSQKHSQNQRQSQNRALKVKLTRMKKQKGKTNAVHANQTDRPRDVSKKLPTTPPPPKVTCSENLRLSSPRQQILSSEVYEFPESPVQTRECLIQIYRREAERQVLRTIQKMTEELKILRQRQRMLKQNFPELR